MLQLLAALAVSLLLCGLSEGQNVLASPSPSPPPGPAVDLSGSPTVQMVMEHMSQQLENTLRPLMDMVRVPGKMYSNPAASCKEIRSHSPQSPSGYYWIRTSAGTPVQVFCDMNVMCGSSQDEERGGWMRLASIDMSTPDCMCPENLTKWVDTYSSSVGCVKTPTPNESCSSVFLSTLGIKYSKVCGMAKGYQWGLTDAFKGSSHSDINGAYVDGVSITHGSPRKHIWTMAAAQHEVPFPNPTSLCSCTHPRARAPPPPSFVGDDYFCETGAHERAGVRLYSNNYLWDGQNCGGSSTCCHLNNPPWFLKTLSSPSSDHLEIRLCTYGPSADKDVILRELQLFVQ